MIQLELADLKRDWVEESAARFPALSLPAVWSADDLHGLLPQPQERNWFGVLLASLKNRALIEKVGYKPSTRPEANGRGIAAAGVGGAGCARAIKPHRNGYAAVLARIVDGARVFPVR